MIATLKSATPILDAAVAQQIWGFAEVGYQEQKSSALLQAQLRAAVQRHTDIGFIFAGSKTTLLNDMTMNPARPFYRMGIRYFLAPIPREEFAAFISRGFEKAGYRVDAAAVEGDSRPFGGRAVQRTGTVERCLGAVG